MVEFLAKCEAVQFSSVPWPFGCRGDISDDSVEITLQSVLQEALVSSSGMGRDVHSLMLSIQHFFCRPRRRPPSDVSWRMVLERLPWRVTCPNHAKCEAQSYKPTFWPAVGLKERFQLSFLSRGSLNFCVCSTLARKHSGLSSASSSNRVWLRFDLTCFFAFISCQIPLKEECSQKSQPRLVHTQNRVNSLQFLIHIV